MRVFLFLLFVAASFVRGAENSPAPIYVVLWFDTEDYLLPADDDAAKRLAEMLTAAGVRATFKVVGEKARVLERRGRQDVIAALKKHDIGYHANFHSVHPTPAEYLGNCGLLDGMAEFIRREGPGAADVRRIFGVPTLACYGQPGSSWGPQAIAALSQIGVAPHNVACYVDDGNHIGLHGYPFWFENAIVVYDMADHWTRMELHDAKAVQPGKDKVSAIARELAGEGGGLISIYYHPCEWVHKEFWDGVNFRRGANPPREEWKAPPQLSAEATEGAFQRFGEYVAHIKSIPNVRFVTAGDLPELYRDSVEKDGVTPEELDALARKILETPAQVNFITMGRKTFSAAEQFDLLAGSIATLLDGQKAMAPIPCRKVLGPDSAVGNTSDIREIRWLAFRDAVRDVNDYLRVNRRVPARLFVGAEVVRPEDFLITMASAYGTLRQAGALPQSGTIPLENHVKFLPAEHVAQDTPGLFGGWVIHKEGYRAPKILEVARLQSWTLKPAKLIQK